MAKTTHVQGKSPSVSKPTKRDKSKTRAKTKRDADRDAFDSRDLVYRPALVELPLCLLPEWKYIVPLNQGQQGACTGFGLAASINYQLAQRLRRRPAKVKDRVSAQMLFQQAKRFDQWAGTKYDYSSARGAMKGWFKTGACSEANWPNDHVQEGLTREQQFDALKIPLGAYYRVLPRRTDVHAALSEVGVVFVVADTHAGWDDMEGAEAIAYDPATGANGGGHAFAIVGYTDQGFLVQNSWGETWGGFRASGRARAGVAVWHYADFDRNVWDLWVVRLALPVESLAALQGRTRELTGLGERENASGPPRQDIRDHYVHIDNGVYNTTGNYPSYKGETESLLDALLQGNAGGPIKQLLLFAHGGLNTVDGAASRVGKWRNTMAANRIGELHFIWETGLVAEIADLILGKKKRIEDRVAGASDWWDDWVERMTRDAGYAIWKEMRDDAADAFVSPASAGTDVLVKLIDKLNAKPNAPAIHLVCHSAGVIWMGHLLDRWEAANGPLIASITYMAPACTVDFFFEHHVPHLQSGLLKSARLFILSDRAEQDDHVAQVYRKSLLYLVTRAFQQKNAIVPLLGLETSQAEVVKRLTALGLAAALPTVIAQENSTICASKSHGGFDNDLAMMNHVLTAVLGTAPGHAFSANDMKGY